MERPSSTTVTRVTSCPVPGNERANWTEHGLGLLPLALVSCVCEFSVCTSVYLLVGWLVGWLAGGSVICMFLSFLV